MKEKEYDIKYNPSQAEINQFPDAQPTSPPCPM